MPPATSVMNRKVLNKVPKVTIYFWIIKILCTIVGEFTADYLHVNLNWGLTATSVATEALVIVVRTVAFVSVFGTLVTDNLTDNLGVPLETSTIVFSVLLGLVFLAGYVSETTLAILVTFALGTASGDLVSGSLGLGFLGTGLLCAGLIAAMTVAWRLGLDAVLAFWFAYIVTRPLGTSIGDYLTQSSTNGGLNLGVTVTSLILLTAIVAIVIYLSVRKPDVIAGPTDPAELAALDEPETAPHHRHESARTAMIQTAVTLVLVVVLVGIFLHHRCCGQRTRDHLPAG